MLRNHFLAHKFIHFTILSSSSSDNIYFQFERLRILLKQDHVPPVVDRGVAQKALNDFKARPPRKHRKSHGQISFLNLSKTVSARWNALDPQLQQPFRDVAKVEAVHRQKLYQEWKAKYGGQQPHEEASDESEDCEDSDDDENPQGSASLVARRTETKTKKKNKKLEIRVVKEVDAATPPSGVLQSSKTSSFQSQTKQSEMRNSSLSLANEGILHHGSSFPQQEETMRGMVVKSRPIACTTPVRHHRQHEVATYNKTKSLSAPPALVKTSISQTLRNSLLPSLSMPPKPALPVSPIAYYQQNEHQRGTTRSCTTTQFAPSFFNSHLSMHPQHQRPIQKKPFAFFAPPRSQIQHHGRGSMDISDHSPRDSSTIWPTGTAPRHIEIPTFGGYPDLQGLNNIETIFD